MGELGHLMHLAFSPEMLGIAAASLATKALVETIESLNKEFERLKAITFELPQMVGMFESVTTAIRNAGIETQQFKDHLAEVANTQKTLSEQMTKGSEELTEHNSVIDSFIKKTESSLEALLKLSVESGKITKAEAAQISFKESLAGEKAAHQREVQESFREGDAAAHTREMARMDIAETKHDLPQREKSAALAASNLESLKGDIAKAKEFLQSDEVNKLVDLQQGMFKTAQGHGDWTSASPKLLGDLRKQLEEGAATERGTPAGNVPTSFTARFAVLDRFMEVQSQFLKKESRRRGQGAQGFERATRQTRSEVPQHDPEVATGNARQCDRELLEIVWGSKDLSRQHRPKPG
jgi:hypothetical protein